ncbi:MAG: sulfatase-like hydrolase/transferase [Chitinophagales bacterium]
MRYYTFSAIFIFLASFLHFNYCTAQQARFPVKEINDTLTLNQFLNKYPHKINAKSSEKGRVRNIRPNILFVMTDDARWDGASVNGAPAYLQTPNFDRIANEGVNFKNFFAVLPLCSPSRSTFYTGLYPHKHGVVNNAVNLRANIPWISEILHDAGYYTVMAGKLAYKPDSIRGFDDFMISVVESYENSKYLIWTGDTAIQLFVAGHTTDLLTQYVIGKMQTRPPDQPFFIYLPHRAVHVPYRPRGEDSTKFANDTMPYINANKYTKNFPSYYYPFNEAGDSAVQAASWRGYFRMLIGVEETFGKILHYMDSVGLTDETLIMYTSDNGDLKSEHLLQGKQLPQEESMLLPMFLRYPIWFPEHKDIYDQLGCNIDWAPTLLDAAQVPDTFGMDGLSLRALANNEVTRDAFMYELWAENYTPAIRVVRSRYFKYINSFCSDTTEQLFDLVNDPLENTNLINDPYYQVVAQYYRCKLDSFRLVLHDTANVQSITHENADTIISSDSLIFCKLKNADSTHVGESENPGPIGTCAFPVFDIDTTFSPVGIDDPLHDDAFWDVTVFNVYGEVMISEKRYYQTVPGSQLVLTQSLSPGIYIVEFRNKYLRLIRKIISQ